MVAFVQLQLGVEHCDGRCDVNEYLAKARLAFAQGALGVTHPQQCAQGRQQHIRVDRVNQVGIAAGIEAGDDVAGLDGGCGHMDQWQQRGIRVGAKLARDVEAAHVRQVDIENQGIRHGAGHQRQPVAAGARLQHLVAMALQHPAHRVAGSGVVVDDQQTAFTPHRFPPPRC